MLQDLGSRHGTFVNGDRIERHALEHGDFVKVGDSVFLCLLRPDDAAGVAGASLHLEDLDYVAESTIQIPAGDTHKLWLGKLQASLEPSSRTEDYLRALLEISSAIHSIRSVEPLARRVLELVAEVVPAERVALWMVDAGEGELHTVHPEGGDVRLSRTTVERAIRGRQAVLCNDVLHATTFDHADSLHAAHISAFVCAPLLLPDRPLGVLYVDTRDPGIRFHDDQLELITAVAAITAVALENARHVEWLEGENRRLRIDRLDHDMVGKSPAMEKAFRFMSRVAPTDSTVLICGESGTGKELMAQAIHRNSARAEQPFVAINCATLSRELLESELFGHERGAFTGAVKSKRGQFEVANGGTVFLDEIGEIPPELQAALLRALEERRFTRVGGTHPIEVDIRVIAATNRDLKTAIREGAFREDLYYRLNVISLTMPPLRDRRDDIPLLANHFVARGTMHHRPVSGISPEAVKSLIAYDWPGNVRELANAIERAMVLGQGEHILPEDLPEAVLECPPTAGAEPTTYHEAVNQAKRQLIRQALADSGGSVAEAARRLGLHRNYLHRLLRNLGLKPKVPR